MELVASYLSSQFSYPPIELEQSSTMNPLMFAISLAAIAPIFTVSILFTYAQAGLGYEIKPEYIVGGIVLIFGLSVFILHREARRIFGLIDSVPQLSSDVSGIREDVKEIRSTVKDLLPWKEDMSERVSVIEFALDIRRKKGASS